MGIAGAAGTVALTVWIVPLSVRMSCLTRSSDHEFAASVSLHSTVKATPLVKAALLRV